MNSEASTPTLWVRVYTPDGYQAALTLPITSVADALAHFDAIRAAGLTATLPVAGGLDDGESADTITTVVRREKENKHGNIVSIIDCYWEGAEYSFATIYLDEPAQIAEFELHSGQRVNDMPVYESDNAKRLDPAKPSRYERKCTPFVAVRKKADKEVKVKGEMVRPWRFVRYGTLAAPAAPKAADPFAGTAFDDSNPFENPATQAAITATIKKHGLDKNGGVAFLLKWAHPDHPVDRISDLHPALTPDQFITAIPSLAGRYQDEKAKAQKGAAANEAAVPLAKAAPNRHS